MKKAAGWGYFYIVRPHYGEETGDKSFFRKDPELGYDLPLTKLLYFHHGYLGHYQHRWALRDGNDLLAHYTSDHPLLVFYNFGHRLIAQK